MKGRIILVFSTCMGVVYSLLATYSFLLYYGDYNKRFHEAYIPPTSQDKVIGALMFYGFPLLIFIINFNLLGKDEKFSRKLKWSLIGVSILVISGLVFGILTGILPRMSFIYN